MRRRALLSGLLLAPFAGRAQETADLGRPGLRRGARPGVDEALRRTVTLVLRAEARSGTLPDFMADPAPLDEAVADAILPGGPIPEGLDYRPVPENNDRRLPHARRGSVWVAADRVDLDHPRPRRLVVLIAHDVLPPEM